VSDERDAGLKRIKDIFEQRFEAWKVRLPIEDAEARRPGFLRQVGGSGSIRYVFRHGEKGEYLEYYSFHRLGGDSHRRIYASGEVEDLDVLQTMYMVSDDPEETKQRGAEMHERNRKLLEELDRVGLRAGGPVPNSFEINAYLVTGDRDVHDPDR
jgi:hypothetical protein